MDEASHVLKIHQHGYTKTGECSCGARFGPVPGDRVDQLIREFSIHIGIYRKPLKETVGPALPGGPHDQK